MKFYINKYPQTEQSVRISQVSQEGQSSQSRSRTGCGPWWRSRRTKWGFWLWSMEQSSVCPSYVSPSHLQTTSTLVSNKEERHIFIGKSIIASSLYHYITSCVETVAILVFKQMSSNSFKNEITNKLISCISGIST